MSILRFLGLSAILAFGSLVVAAGFMTEPASAGKMNGKPGGGPNVAHYGPTKNTAPSGQHPAKTKNPTQ